MTPVKTRSLSGRVVVLGTIGGSVLLALAAMGGRRLISEAVLARKQVESSAGLPMPAPAPPPPDAAPSQR